LQISEYQAWLRQWDEERTWEQVLPSHTLLHAMEELGEISKLVQMLEGYRPLDPADRDEVRAELALELSDLQVMLFKIAYLFDIDMETAMTMGQQKADRRYPDPKTGPAARQAYWRRFHTFLAESNLSLSQDADENVGSAAT